MAARTREDRRLRQLSATCLALPEAERTDCGAHADFRVRGKIFAYFLKNHGGDGITAACFKGRLGEHVEHVKRAPDRFYLPRYIGRRGWVGVRLDRGDIDWQEVASLATISYNLVAPKGLRSSPAANTNVLTARTLVRGPVPVIEAAQAPPSPPQLVDGIVMQDGRTRDDPTAKLLQGSSVAGTANLKGSGGVRGRR